MCLVYFSDANLVNSPSAEAVGRTGDVPGSVGLNHVCLFLMLSYSASVSTVQSMSSASVFVGMLMTHFWRYF